MTVPASNSVRLDKAFGSLLSNGYATDAPCEAVRSNAGFDVSQMRPYRPKKTRCKQNDTALERTRN
jgi:hypothetical protein